MIVEYSGVVRSVLRVVDDFGFQSYDLLGPPRRLFLATAGVPLLESNIDKRRVCVVKAPSDLFASLPAGENWLSVTGRSLARLYATFLIAEDPQRRLDVHKAATLMHQVSLVQHILSRPDLRKVLIGDEVGLGKTIEAGLLIRRLVEQNHNIRVLYLAPARLVSNVTNELRDKLDLDARKWVAGNAGDARLESDRIVVASLNKAVFGDNFDRVVGSGPWDVLVVDECHHLSDWGQTGGKPNQAFRLVSQLVKAQNSTGRLILMSGTPHQGSEARFKNLLRLLSDDGKTYEDARGKVIFRTKDRVRDWRNLPLFPRRNIRQPTVVRLGREYEQWYAGIADLYDRPSETGYQKRAAAWAKGQALQWAASSVQAGLGFLVRLAMRRLDWGLTNTQFAKALAVLRPYRGGASNEPLDALYKRLQKQIGLQTDFDDSVSDSEDLEEEPWAPNAELLEMLLRDGIQLLDTNAGHAKWEALCKIIDDAEDEKIVFFAQPVETVGVVSAFLKNRYGVTPAIIIGNQSDDVRTEQVRLFQIDEGPQFLVSSKAGGEGLNMQRARRLVHLDVPWNPMEMEQRVGRVHRFGSRKTIIVDTVVAAGSREVDMYRIARDKLALIASQLDPDQFEDLFNRVMSLVPPKELEAVIGEARSSAFGTYESNEIGRLVTEGYSAWNNFDQTYRHEADRIRAIEPGQASWADLGHFLTKYGNAEAADEVSLATFEFRGDQIESIEENLPAIRIGSRTYVCGDTGGLPVETRIGDKAYPVGLNVEEIIVTLRNAFLPDRETGAAILRRSIELDRHLPPLTQGLIAVMRQSVRYQAGICNEANLSLHMFAVASGIEPVELNPDVRSKIIRVIMSAQRARDGDVQAFGRLLEVEAQILAKLRIPTEDEIARNVRHGVWPIAAIGFLPSIKN